MRPLVVLVVPLLACTFDASGFGDPPNLASESGIGLTEPMTGTTSPGSSPTAATVTEGTSDIEESGTTTMAGGPTSDPTTTTGPDPTTGPDLTTGPESTGPDETTAAPCEMVELHPDADGDTYGDKNATMMVCVGAPGYVEDGGDCNDAAGDVHPGVNEKCNGADDDCDDVVDEFDPNENKTECGSCRFKIEKSRLYYFCDVEVNWADARAYCQAHKLDLAVDNDNGEHDFLWDEAGWDSGMWWIGGSDQEAEGVYKWVDFGDVPVPDPRWGPEQPNNVGGGQNADCIGIVAEGIYNDGFFNPPEVMKKWVDHTCGTERPFICEGTAP